MFTSRAMRFISLLFYFPPRYIESLRGFNVVVVVIIIIINKCTTYIFLFKVHPIK